MTAKHDAKEMADLRRRADAGDIDVQVYLGQELVASPDAADREEGRERLARAAQAGDLDAYSHLGLSLITSAVGPADFERGRAVLEKGASLGSSWCLYNLGIVHQQGAGVPVDLARASVYWAKAAEAGNGAAAYNLSVQYAKGLGVAPDLRVALRWAELADKCGDERGGPYARAIRRELGVPETVGVQISSNQHADLMRAIALEQLQKNFERDPSAPATPPESSAAQAAPTLEQRANAGDSMAQLELAMKLRDSNDFREAAVWFEKVAAQGSVIAHLELGNYYAKKSPYNPAGSLRERQFHKAREHYAAAVRGGLREAKGLLDEVEDEILAAMKQEKAWRQAAAGGDPDAHYRLGLRLLEGSHAPADIAGALSTLEESARIGHAGAAATLFKLYETGAHGVSRNSDRAREMLAVAAAAGDGDAMFLFVRRYADGRITDTELPGAATLFSMCRQMYPDYRAPGTAPRAPQELHAKAKEGDLEATYLLAMALYEGAGVEQSHEKSLQCLRIASDKGYAPAQIELARRHARGDGVPQDLAAGRPLAIAAARQGHLEARAELMMFGVPQDQIEAILAEPTRRQ